MKQNSNMPTRVEPLKFYKTRDMREHEEKSKMAVKTFLENLNNRPKKNNHPTSTSTSVLSATTSLQSTQNNVKTTAQPSTKASTSRLITSVRSTSANSTTTAVRSARTTTAQKTKLSQNNKNKSIKASVDSTDIQCKEPLKFYKTKNMREHEEKSKWAVQTFWENLNNRSKKSAQSNENTIELQSLVNVSAEISGTSISQTYPRSTEQVKAIGRSNKLSSESTNKASTQAFSQSMAEANENGISYASSSSPTAQWAMEISIPDVSQPLTKFSNKRKHSGDGEISSRKSIKITIPATPKQKEFSMKVNLPNRPSPKVNNNIQSIGSVTSKNCGVKSLVQLCTMTLVSNRHRLYQLGNAPYHLLEPILKFCTDEELRQLEEVNSRLIDEDMELWKRFLMQKLPDQPLPDNPEDYRKVYLDIIDEEKEKKERIIGNFRRAMAEEKAKKEARQVKILPVAPREPKRRPSGYQKLTTLQKIRREMIREGYVMFPHHT